MENLERLNETDEMSPTNKCGALENMSKLN
jgi:hypothetical protein